MCGIVGILGQVSRPNNRDELLERMTNALRHRGPDGWGTYGGRHVALGHRRLSVIDLTGGNQPMTTGRFVISYNGEIFNYVELRQQLRNLGHSFETDSDTEVLLRMFETYGTACFEKLNGQFAFLIWDRVECTLTAVRDRYGIRPLYVLHHDDAFYFASEMKAFDQIAGYTREYDRDLLLEHGLLWNTLGADTVYRHIRSVASGTAESYTPDGQQTVLRYYQLGQDACESPPTLEQAEEDLVAILTDAVRLRLRSDVAVANYLSGGIDSSVITHLTKEHNGSFATFSVSFADHAYDESRYQQMMVQAVGSEHHDLEVDYSAINENLIAASYHFERPVFRTAPVPLFLLSDAVRRNGIKVVLTGEAADEILYGYDTYKEVALLSAWSADPDSEFAEKAIAQLYPHLDHFNDPKKLGFIRMYYKDFVNSVSNPLVGLNIRLHNNAALARAMNVDLTKSNARDRIFAKVEQSLPADFSRWSLLQRNQYLEMQTLLSGYLLSSQGDRMSMAHGVEGRYPFLDHRLVERVFGYRDTFKLHGLSQKHVLRRAFAAALPNEIIDRPKMPYQAPDLKSFFCNGRLTDEAESLLNTTSLRDAGIFDPEYVTKLVRKYSTRMPDSVGYRDNMILTFLLTTQATSKWMKNPVEPHVCDSDKTVSLCDAILDKRIGDGK